MPNIMQVTQTVPFSSFPYKRPDLTEFQKTFSQNLETLQKANNEVECFEILKKINHDRADFMSLQSLCHVRHTLNTADSFYENENEFFDQAAPHFQDLNDQFYKAMVTSPHRVALENTLGKQFFDLADMGMKCFKNTIIADLQEENRLSSEYTKLRARAKIKFGGKVYNLSTIAALEEDADPTTRRGAVKAKWRFFNKNKAVLDVLFDDLVKVRHRIAQQLGFDNFVQLGYMRMSRSEYGDTEVQQFRHQIEQHIVPITTKLYDRQRRRLAYKKLNFYDESFKFKTGNPTPQGQPKDIIEAAVGMYREMSPETGEFFDYMFETGLMDLVARDNKATGGYCTYLNNQQAPFIFSNFNGTSGDVDVLTHEAGHAFQVWLSRNQPMPEYNWPTYEACEIHSMSMELFAWPWMDRFFGADEDKYRYDHLGSAVAFLPYGAAVDAFQHWVYQNPEATPEQRNQHWTELENKFLPHRIYTGLPLLEEGRFWQKQSHIYQSPFYYIDYALAQICALQYWVWYKKEPKAAWESYIDLCRRGGSAPFLQLVRDAGLRDPFDPEAIREVAEAAAAYLDGIDDSAF